jgi:hypothetical protein
VENRECPCAEMRSLSGERLVLKARNECLVVAAHVVGGPRVLWPYELAIEVIAERLQHLSSVVLYKTYKHSLLYVVSTRCLRYWWPLWSL